MSEKEQTAMQENGTKLCGGEAANLENLWSKLRVEAARVHREEEGLRALVDDVVLSRGSFAEALSVRLSRRLAREDMPRETIEPLIEDIFTKHESIARACSRDLLAMFERDPACFSPWSHCCSSKASWH